MRTPAREVARARSKRKAPADPQQAAVYDWEAGWKAWNREDLTLAECRACINWACDQFKVSPPRVRSHPGRAYPWFDTDLHAISFSRRGKNVATALHEAAHVIVFDQHGEAPQDHGPTFLGVYMWLLETAGVAPRIALHATARAHGLRWRTIDAEAGN